MSNHKRIKNRNNGPFGNDFPILQSVFDACTTGMLLLNERGEIRLVNSLVTSMVCKASQQGGVWDILRCIRREKAGESPYGTEACKTCPLRKAVQDAFSFGKSIRGLEAEFYKEGSGNITKCWMRIHVDPIRIEGERHVIIALDDITTLKETEISLQENLAFLRSLIDTIPSPVFFQDLTGRYLSCNHQFSHDIMGSSKEEIIGRTMEELQTSIPDSILKENREQDRMLRPNGGVQIYDIQIPSTSGAPRYYIVYKTLFTGTRGTPLGIVGVMQDITQRKMVEETLWWESTINVAIADLSRSLLSPESQENISQQVLECARTFTESRYGFVGYLDSATGHLKIPTMTNEIWEECQVAGKKDEFSHYGGLWGCVMKQRKSIRSNQPASDSRSQGTPQGHIPIRRFLGVPALSGDSLLGIIALANAERDYTERDQAFVERLATLFAIALERRWTEKTMLEAKIQAEMTQIEIEYANRQLEASAEQARLMMKEAEAANNAKSQFLANMTHEIRTPLSAVIGYSELLNQETLTMEQREYVNTIHSSSQHLLDLINNILDLSRIEANQMHLSYSDCSLSTILKTVESVTRPAAIQKGLTYELWIHPDVPDPIRIDEVRLRQCLINLISNAIKFTHLGGVTIRVFRDNAILRFEIIDTGIGISLDRCDALFKPFSQIDNSITREFGGSGLGLVITKRLAEAMNGNVQIKSELGKGSTFTLTVLPEVSSHSRQNMDDGKKNPAITSDKSIHFLGNILIAEDDTANQRLLQIMLKRLELNVIVANNGQEVLDILDQQSVDVIFMDMHMPIMSGYEATRAIRNRGLSIPVIALTASNLKDENDRCRGAGCNEYLVKPAQMEHIQMLLAHYLTPKNMVSRSTPRISSEPHLNEACSSNRSTNTPVLGTAGPANEKESSFVVYWNNLLDLCNDAGVIQEIAAALQADMPKLLSQLLEAAKNNHTDQLRMISHRLRGASKTIAAEDLAIAAKRVEELCQQGNVREAIESVPTIELQIKRLLEFLGQPNWMDPIKHAVSRGGDTARLSDRSAKQGTS